MSIFEEFTSKKTLPPSKEEEAQELLNDLRLVGETKPLGYLPISTLRDICGVEPQEIREELEAKGLVVMELTEEETNVGSGALYVYDRDTLSHFLNTLIQSAALKRFPPPPPSSKKHPFLVRNPIDLLTLS